MNPMKRFLAPVLLLSAMLLVGWTFLVDNFLGLPLKVATPTNGQLWKFVSATNDYQLSTDAGGAETLSISDLTDVDPMTEVAGDLLTVAGTSWTKLAIGSAGQVLTVAGGLPTWATPTVGSGITIQETDGTPTETAPTVLVVQSGQFLLTDTGTVETLSIATGGVTSTSLGADAVTSAKILDGEIVSADLSAAAGITSAQVLNGTLVSADLSASAGITSAQILDTTIVVGNLAAALSARLPPTPATNGGVVIDTGAAYTITAQGAANTVLHGVGAGTPTFSGVVSADVTNGTLVSADLSAAAGLTSAQILDGEIVLADLNAALQSAAQGTESTRKISTSAAAALGTAGASGSSVQASAADHVHAASSVTVNGTAHGATTTLVVNGAGPISSSTASGTTNITISHPDRHWRNAIINGEFEVAQRGTSFPAVGSSYHLDRWFDNVGGAAAHTVTQDSSVPTFAQAGKNTRNSLKVDCTTADASIAAGDFTFIRQRIEGSRWLACDQKPLVLSFWVNATKTGTYCVALMNSGSDRSCVLEYTVNAADTWEFKTLLFPANPTAGTWNYTTGIGAQLSFTLASGSTFHTTAGSYQTGLFLATANQVNATDSTANNFHLAMVQLEPGTVAPPPTPTTFEARDFGTELLLCQRYYSQLGGSASLEFMAAGMCFSTTLTVMGSRLPVEMRATPTLSTGTLSDLCVITAVGGQAAVTALSATYMSRFMLGVQATVASGLVAGNGAVLTANNNTNARLKLDAEL